MTSPLFPILEADFLKTIFKRTFRFNVKFREKCTDSPGFPGRSVVKNPPANVGDGFSPWVGKIPWRREWQPTVVFLPGKSHGQRSLVGYSPWSPKESDMTEQLHFHFMQYNLILT